MKEKHYTVFKKQCDQKYVLDPKYKFEIRDSLTRADRADIEAFLRNRLKQNQRADRVSYSDIYGGPIPEFLRLRGIS